MKGKAIYILWGIIVKAYKDDEYVYLGAFASKLDAQEEEEWQKSQADESYPLFTKYEIQATHIR